MPDGLIMVNASGLVQLLNPAAERILGVTSAAVTGQPILRCGRLAEIDLLADALASAAAGQSSQQIEHKIGPAFYRLAITPMERGSLLIILRDITKEKQADQLKDALISTVSHELRTPLAAIKGYATTLLRKDVAWDAATTREFLQIIDDESDRLRELIDSLLEMSKIEAGVLRLDHAPTHIGRIAQRAIFQVRHQAQQHRFITSFPPDFPLVEADPRRIEQVLRNLLENAVKYSPAGGRVTVEGRVLRDASDLQPFQEHLTAAILPSILVSVSDEGTGIPGSELERVFDRFHRVEDADSRRRAGGSGLGLSICKGIVEAHGGIIWAESILGKGSTFRFTLPLV